MSHSYNPYITISSPFPRVELPMLFAWRERIKDSVVDDSMPQDLDSFMKSCQYNENYSSWAVYHDGEIGGYIEARAPQEYASGWLIPELKCPAQMSAIFKADIWRGRYTRTAVNLALRELFDDSGADLVFFPVLAHNEPLKRLYFQIWAKSIELIIPRKQNDAEVAAELYALSVTEWENRNSEFLFEVEQSEQSPEVVSL